MVGKWHDKNKQQQQPWKRNQNQNQNEADIRGSTEETVYLTICRLWKRASGTKKRHREMGNPKQKWTSEEEEALRAGVAKHGTGKWKDIQRDPEFNPFLSSRSNIDLKVSLSLFLSLFYLYVRVYVFLCCGFLMNTLSLSPSILFICTCFCVVGF